MDSWRTLCQELVPTFLSWPYYRRRRRALVRLIITQVLLIVLLDHQLAFLGAVESSSTLIAFFGEFVLIAVGTAAAFGYGVMGSTILLKPLRRST